MPPSASDCSSCSDTESLDSAGTTWIDTRYGAGAAPAPQEQQAAPAWPPRRPQQQQPQPSSASESSAAQPSRQPGCSAYAEDGSGLFTPSSFASRREPLSGNLRYRKIKDINRCAPAQLDMVYALLIVSVRFSSATSWGTACYRSTSDVLTTDKLKLIE